MVSILLLVRRKNEYIRFSKDTGQRTQYARMDTAEFDWKKGKAVEKVALKHENGVLSVFKLNSQYKDGYGRFDFGQAQFDYENFLTSVPDKNRIYLQQSFESVSYHEGDVYKRPFAYIPKEDSVWYDPNDRSFWNYTFIEANTHELAHRIDAFLRGLLIVKNLLMQ